MANDSLKTVVTRKGATATPQTKKAAPGQKKNNAGGYTFTVDALNRIKRFLILGSEASFYQSGAKLSLQNAKTIQDYVGGASLEQTTELIDLITEVSVEGRAAKQQPALFALALVIATTEFAAAKNYGYAQLQKVARTGTTLFEFAGFLSQFQRFGMGAQKAFARWYTSKTIPQVAYQAAKYQSREGFTHADILRLSKRVRSNKDGLNPEASALYDWIVGRKVEFEALPKLIQGVELAKTADAKKIPDLIRKYGLSWEMVPSEALNRAEVWEALLDGNLPLGALLRNLPKLTRVGVISPLGGRTAEIVSRLTDQDALIKARIHPLNILIALKTYSGGRSLRGTESWTPVPKIVDALDKAFYLAFKAVEPAGKRTLIGLDVSGSMAWGQVAGVPLMPSEAVAALSLVTAAVEPEVHIVGFANTVRDLGISPRMRLDDVLRKTASMTFGSTDASAAIRYALDQGLKVDTFIVMTDNETYAGHSHPHEALEEYRRKTGIQAKLIVVATTATKFTIADPNDAGMLDIAGFDTAVPRLITEFSKGL